MTQTMTKGGLLLLSLCPWASGFKSTSTQHPSLSGAAAGGVYRRPRKGGGSSRSHVSLWQESPCVLRLAADGEDPPPPDPTRAGDGADRRISVATTDKAEIVVASGDSGETTVSSRAATSTVNERLLAEIEASVEREKYGSKKQREYFKEFRSQKTDEERERSLQEARDLNGVNPLVCIGGASFAWACAGALWVLTTYLGALFASHPLDIDVYFVQRLAQVFRNAVMGLSSLASGFFGVVGIGIFLLGVRVAYGVVTGELDPTPIKRPKGEEIVLPDVWSLMMGKRPNRRGRRGLGGGMDDNPFGL